MITIPHITKGPDPSSVTTTTGAITDFIVTETRTQLTVDSWLHSSKKFSDFDISRIKKNYALQQRYLRDDIAYRLADNFDSKFLGQTGAVKDMNLHVGTSLVSISNTTITDALSIAETQSLPLKELGFFIHPTVYWKQLFRRTALIDASQLGRLLVASAVGDVRPLGSLYGVPVWVANQVGLAQGLGADGYPVTVRRNLLIHPRAVVYAYGRLTPDGPRLREMDVADAMAVRAIGDLMYGVKLAGKDDGVRIMSVK